MRENAAVMRETAAQARVAAVQSAAENAAVQLQSAAENEIIHTNECSGKRTAAAVAWRRARQADCAGSADRHIASAKSTTFGWRVFEKRCDAVAICRGK